MPRPARLPSRAFRRGFTLIELTVVIGIIAILAGALLPVITQPYIHERRAELQKEMSAIEEAISGRPELGDFGFLGTMGYVPTNLNALVDKSVIPGAVAGTVLINAGTVNAYAHGWVGPYLRVSTTTPLVDPWGTPYDIKVATTANQVTWQIHSNGPDTAAGTADDVYYPNGSSTMWNSYVMSLALQVLYQTGPLTYPSSAGTTVKLHYPNGPTGADTTMQATTDANGMVTFATAVGQQIPFGQLALEITPPGSPTYIRLITANRAYFSTTASVPLPQTFGASSCPISGSAAQLTGPASCNLAVTASEVVQAQFSGQVHGSAANTRCLIAISLGQGNYNTNDLVPQSSGGIDLSAGGSGYWQYGTTEATSSAPNAPVTATTVRTKLFPSATTVYPSVVVQASGGTCTVDYGSLTLSGYQP